MQNGGSQMSARNDTASAAVVAAGIQLDQDKGAAVAWEYMSRRNIPVQVILRVLTNASKRRPGDPVAATLDEQRAARP
jgi:hypothetical protein